MIFWQLAALLEKHELDLKTPVNQIPEEVIHEIIHGSEERIKINGEINIGATISYPDKNKKYPPNASETGEKINNLFMMTPYAYRTGREDRGRVMSLESLVTEAEFCIAVYRKI